MPMIVFEHLNLWINNPHHIKLFYVDCLGGVINPTGIAYFQELTSTEEEYEESNQLRQMHVNMGKLVPFYHLTLQDANNSTSCGATVQANSTNTDPLKFFKGRLQLW